MTIAALFLLLNPAAIAMLWLGYERGVSPRTLAIGAVAGAFVLGLAVILGRPLLDGLDISAPTFRIASGVLVVFGAFQAFLGLGLRNRLPSENWAILALAMWIASPPVLAAGIAVRIDEGLVTGLLVAVLAVLVAAGLSGVWLWRYADRHGVVLGWARRVFAAVAAVGGIDLIRQGVLSI